MRSRLRFELLGAVGLLGVMGVASLHATPVASAASIRSQREVDASVCRPPAPSARRQIASLKQANSIGIAYFAGRSRGGDDAHLATALTTEIAKQLLGARTVNADPRRPGASRPLVVKLSEGGGFVDVDLSMTGSLFRENGLVRTTVKLTRTSDGSVIWSGSKARPVLELPILARLIAQEVAIRTGAQLSPAKPSRSSEKSAEMYELLLRGMYIPSRYDPDQLLQAIDYFTQAIRLDSSSARARELRDLAQLRLVAWGGNGSALESQLLASGALQRIQARPRDDSERLVEQADNEIRAGSPMRACQLLNSAIDRDARSAPAYALRALVLARGGEFREAFGDAETVTQLGRPLWGNSLRVIILRRTGDTTAARVQTRQLVASIAKRRGALPFWDARFVALALTATNDVQEVDSVLRRIDAHDPRLAWARRDILLQGPSAKSYPRSS